MPTYPARREVPWDVDDGHVVLEPPQRPGRLQRWLRSLLRAPRRSQVRLDEEGSRAWLLADGTRTLEAVAEELPHGGDEDVRRRLGTFYRSLHERGVLAFQGEPEPVEDPLRGFPRHEEVRCPCGRTVRLPGDRAGKVRYRCPHCGERRTHP